jgi:hypothetical protein
MYVKSFQQEKTGKALNPRARALGRTPKLPEKIITTRNDEHLGTGSWHETMLQSH